MKQYIWAEWLLSPSRLKFMSSARFVGLFSYDFITFVFIWSPVELSWIENLFPLSHDCYLCLVHGAMGCGQKNFQLVWRSHQLLSGFLAKGHLPRVSRQSSRSPMIRVIMRWSWGLCTDFLALALQLRKAPETSARRPSDEGAVRPSGWEKEGNKERTEKLSMPEMPLHSTDQFSPCSYMRSIETSSTIGHWFVSS